MNRLVFPLAVLLAATVALLTNHLDGDAWLALVAGGAVAAPGLGEPSR